MGCCSAKLNAEGTYDPSSFTISMATSPKTEYCKQTYEETYGGSDPILVVCTDDGRMKMANDKIFNTGNHPVEMLVPLLHFRDAGFKFDIATASGKPVVLEMWAYPTKDENVAVLHRDIREMMTAPKSLEDIASLDGYSGIFIPGGHGCMVNLPDNAALGKLLHEAHEKGIPTVSLCHGPSTFLTTALEGRHFAYEGYDIMCFTDKTDAKTPAVGYLPGHMPWKCQKALEDKGMKVLNKGETGATHVDRELITGDSPKAAHHLGVVAAPILVKYANNKVSDNNQVSAMSPKAAA